MIKFYIWCAIIFSIIGYIYGFFAENNDVLFFFRNVKYVGYIKGDGVVCEG